MECRKLETGHVDTWKARRCKCGNVEELLLSSDYGLKEKVSRDPTLTSTR